MTDTEKNLNIMIVDDHKILAESLSRLINDRDNMQVKAISTSGKDSLRYLREKSQEIDLVIMDLRMEEEDTEEPAGLSTARKILKEIYVKGVNEIKILIMTQLVDGYLIDVAHKIGVHGYLTKDADSHVLFDAIEGICLAKRRYFRGEIAEAWDQFSYEHTGILEIPQLTPTEKEILQMISEGLTTKEIAEKRGKGEDGVEAHRRNIMRKLNARNAPHMIALAYQFNMI